MHLKLAEIWLGGSGVDKAKSDQLHISEDTVHTYSTVVLYPDCVLVYLYFSVLRLKRSWYDTSTHDIFEHT